MVLSKKILMLIINLWSIF